MLRSIGTLATALALILTPPALAQSCRDLGPVGALIEALAAGGDPALGEAFCADYGAMATRLTESELAAERLQERVVALEAALPPPEAILLVDRAQGCPAGWTDVALAEPTVFAGRVPVVTGFAEGRAFRAFREVGGSETHQLTEAELPPHGHTLPLSFVRMPGDERGPTSLSPRLTSGQQVAVAARAARDSTARAGGGQAHPTMPPYVGLFFCKRAG